MIGFILIYEDTTGRKVQLSQNQKKKFFNLQLSTLKYTTKILQLDQHNIVLPID